MVNSDLNNNILIRKNLRKFLNKSGIKRIDKDSIDKIEEIIKNQIDILSKMMKNDYSG